MSRMKLQEECTNNTDISFLDMKQKVQRSPLPSPLPPPPVLAAWYALKVIPLK